MPKIMPSSARDRDVLELVDQMSRKHPELKRRIRWSDVLSIAEREGISVAVVPLSRPGRIMRVFGSFEIQINSELIPEERAFVGMHELTHYWKDFDRAAAYYPEDERSEEFANLVADHLTSVSRSLERALGPCVLAGDISSARDVPRMESPATDGQSPVPRP